MNRNRKPHPKKKKLTPFERETERRRREMLRNIAGAKAHIPNSLLRALPRSSRLLLLAKPKTKEART